MPTDSESTVLDLGKPFRLGGCDVDPASGEVSNGEQTVRLQPQAVEVLLYLVERAGEVVSRHEIEDAIWSDRTVGYDALTGTMFKLRKALGDDPKAPKIIETISKRGYRLLVSPKPIERADDAPKPEPASVGGFAGLVPENRSATMIWSAAAAILIAVVASMAAIAWQSTIEPRTSNTRLAAKTKAIVVLPFENVGSRADLAYISDGLTEDLTTVLAKVSGLTVIARDSAVVYKGQQVAIPKLAKTLDVDYVLRGSVREGNGQLRINAQLIDVTDGKHIWADQLDGPIGKVFDLETKIVRKLVASLLGEPASTGAQTQLVARTSSTKAYRAFQLGRKHFYLYLNKQENATARRFFRIALEHDPYFAMAHAMLAWTHAFDVMNGWVQDRDLALQRADETARKALSLNPALPLPYFLTGLVHRERGDYVKAMVDAERAIEVDPNYANAHVLLSTLLFYAGRPEESVVRLKKAMRLNPHHPFNYSFHLGQAYFTLKRYDDAIAALQRGVKSNPASERLHLWLAASFALAGRLEDAEWEAEQVKVLNPEFSISAISKSYPFKDPADRGRFLDGLRKAGLS